MASCSLCLSRDDLKTCLTVYHNWSGNSESYNLECRTEAKLPERKARIDSRESCDIHGEVIFFFFFFGDNMVLQC